MITHLSKGAKKLSSAINDVTAREISEHQFMEEESQKRKQPARPEQFILNGHLILYET